MRVGITLRERQRGQALPFALIFLAVGAAALYLAFNAAQLTHAKTKLQDTADAAAYSVGVLQARDLNFAAYTNRAMIANQVAVAQMVSLKSWVDEMQGTYQMGDHWFDEFIEVTAANSVGWTGPKATGGPIMDGAKSVIDSMAGVAASGIDGLIRILSTEQRAYHASMLVQMPMVADEIAQANEPHTHATKSYFLTRGAVSLASMMKFASEQTPAGRTGSDRFADVVTNKTTLDDFVPSRSGTRLPSVLPFSTVLECPGASMLIAYHTHAGGTQLRPDKQGWEGLDATDVNGGWFCYFEVGFAGGPIVGEAGSGGAATGPGGTYSGTVGYGGYKDFGGAMTDPGTMFAARAQRGAGPGASLSTPGGLQPYLELNRLPTPGDGPDFNRAPAIAVEVQRNSTSIGTTNQLGIAKGELGVDDATAQGQMRAIASASAYFIRPDDPGGATAGGLLNLAHWRRSDKRWEYPSLFNPYWQSSLVATNTAAVVAADAAQATGAP
uniref:Tad domain-containing protein n=1 Tax=Burkholderia anthina TaxID=179879 RepID=UPI00158E9038|nr:Tad domain-containing protein [Burkholderia anthina]